MGKGKKGEKGRRERGEERKKLREGKGEGKKVSGKGILAIPILVCFRRRWTLTMSNKKLSYCRDSACSAVISLRRSKLLKVTDFPTNGRPVCDFLIVKNTNLHPISHRLSYIAHQIVAFDRRFLSLTNSFTETSENIAISHDCYRLDSLVYILSQTVRFYLQPL